MVKECFQRPKENYLLSWTVHPDTLCSVCEQNLLKTLDSSELFSHTLCTLFSKENMVSKEGNKQRRDQQRAKETENLGEEGLVRRSRREMGTRESWHSIQKKVGSTEYLVPLKTLEVDRDGSVAAGQTLELKAPRHGTVDTSPKAKASKAKIDQWNTWNSRAPVQPRGLSSEQRDNLENGGLCVQSKYQKCTKNGRCSNGSWRHLRATLDNEEGKHLGWWLCTTWEN